MAARRSLPGPIGTLASRSRMSERDEMTKQSLRSALMATSFFGLLLIVWPHLSATVAVAAHASPAPFTLCKSTYALCTTARCTPIAGHPGSVSCGCSVHAGYSAATTACRAVQETNAGRSIVSQATRPASGRAGFAVTCDGCGIITDGSGGPTVSPGPGRFGCSRRNSSGRTITTASTGVTSARS